MKLCMQYGTCIFNLMYVTMFTRHVFYIDHLILYSSSKSQQTLPTTPEANLLGVMGVSDWDFLRPPATTSDEEDEIKRPSLDDFDGEIGVFQVSNNVVLIDFIDIYVH